MIEPALAAGTAVLCDRYTDSSRAYQGAGRGLGEAVVDELHRRFCPRVPDRTYLFDCPVEVALARVAGAAEIRVCEPNVVRRDRSLAWGATAGYADAAEVPDGADAVIVAAPVPAAQQRALELAASGGRVNFFAGLARDRSRVELDTNLIHYKELVVTGTTASTNDECRAALDLIFDGLVDTASLIDARFDLSSAREAFELAGSGRALKVVIEP